MFLACCISAFVKVNRFGFALEGVWCDVDRIYYNIIYGQLKDSNHKWKGLSYANNIFENIKKLCTTIPTIKGKKNICLSVGN